MLVHIEATADDKMQIFFEGMYLEYVLLKPEHKEQIQREILGFSNIYQLIDYLHSLDSIKMIMLLE